MSENTKRAPKYSESTWGYAVAPSNYNSDEETANAAGADDNDGGGSDGDSIEDLLRELESSD